MAKHVLKDLKIYYDEFEVTADHNKISMPVKSEEKICTVFGNTAIARLAGMKSFTLSHSGFWEGGDNAIDDQLFDDLGSTARIMTLAPEGGADGGDAYIIKGVSVKYEWGGKVGDILPFSGAVVGEGVPPVRATILGTGTKTTDANGTSRQLGAVSATQKIYAALHVTSATGGGNVSLDVKIQSDDNTNFTSATDRITFTQVLTTNTAEWKSLAGAITDDYWRAVWTLAGSPKTYTFQIIAGIL